MAEIWRCILFAKTAFELLRSFEFCESSASNCFMLLQAMPPTIVVNGGCALEMPRPLTLDSLCSKATILHETQSNNSLFKFQFCQANCMAQECRDTPGDGRKLGREKCLLRSSMLSRFRVTQRYVKLRAFAKLRANPIL